MSIAQRPSTFQAPDFNLGYIHRQHTMYLNDLNEIILMVVLAWSSHQHMSQIIEA
jgi:hypothetical protein